LDIEIIDRLISLDKDTVEREVVRGIAIKDNKILLVYAKDELIYGTPGGGLEKGEDLIQALKREMIEEVGANDFEIIEYIGRMKSYRKDFFTDKIFTPIHHYFLINIKSLVKPKLIDYEKEIGLTNEYIDINQAIETNELAIKDRDQEYLDFYTNQTVILHELYRIYFK
jgi:8-oxo-dGTP pyrophosphatase MutT (NUDIX family)